VHFDRLEVTTALECGPCARQRRLKGDGDHGRSIRQPSGV
jgi:hypothetical protein